MSGFLAFDRDRVGVLALRLVRALDELDDDHRGLTDPAAAGAADELRSALGVLAPWPTRLARIARSGALTDLMTWASPVGDPGLVVVRDERPVASPADAALAAAVLAERFGQLDLDAAPPVVLAELQQLLNGADPATIAAFVATIGPSGLAALLTVLGRGIEATARQNELDSIDAPAAARLVRRLGAGLAAVPDQSAWDTVWRDTDLALAAELLAGAAPRLDDGALTRRSAELLTRVADLDEPDPSAYWRHAGVTVLGALAIRPRAAAGALAELAIDDAGFVLFHLDPGAAGELVRAATDPTLTPADVAPAAERIVSALAAVRGAGGVIESSVERAPGESVAPDWWLHRESRFAPHDARLPVGIGTSLGTWLPWLLEPVQIAGWAAAPGSPVPWAFDGDRLSAAFVELMASDTDALAVRMAATTFLAGAVGSAPATQQHAAYAVAALEDAARTAGLGQLGGRAAIITAGAGATTVVTAGLGPIASTLAGFGLNTAFAPLVPDLRDSLAANEAAGFGLAAGLGWAAVELWRQRHAPDSPPLPARPAADRAEPGDRADEEAARVAELLEEWADGLPAAQRAEVFELYNRVQSAAAQGTGFAA